MKNIKSNTIINTIIGTLSILLCFLLVFVLICYMFFTVSFADFCYNMKYYKTASSLYYSEWEKGNDVNYLYKSIVININIKNYDFVIEKYEELENLSVYDEFIDKLQQNKLKTNANKLLKSTFITEDNYLKNAYVMAFIKDNRVNEAFEYSVNNLNYNEIEINNFGVYTFNNFISDTINGDIKNSFQANYNTEISNYNAIYNYYNCIYQLFVNTDKTEQNEINLIALGNRVILVGSNILFLENKLTYTFELNINLIQNQIDGVNNTIKEWL